MKTLRGTEYVHPLLIEIKDRIQREVIDKYNMPFRLFETGRMASRQQGLLDRGRTKDGLSRHLFDLEKSPPLYCTAIDFVFYNGKWSWNIRNATIRNWYKLFGNLVMDICPELDWGGMNRVSTNYNHFQLKSKVIKENLDKYPCSIF